MKCQSCGRTTSETYCNECVDKEGKLKSFEEVTENLTSYYVETQGFDRQVAKSVATGVLSHQPAWEAKMERIEKGKDMRMKTFLIVTAAVFTVVGAGIAYWLGTRTKADEITSNNFAKTTISPLEQIQERMVGNDMVVYEFKAPGDQNILDFNNSILTFESLDGTVNSPKSSIYNYDVYNRIGFPFDPNSMDTKFLLGSRKNYLQLYKSYSTLNTPPQGKYPFDDPDYMKKEATNSWLYDPVKGTLRSDIEAYQTGDIVVVLDYTKNPAWADKYIWNTMNNIKIPAREGDGPLNVGKRYYISYSSSQNVYDIGDLETGKIEQVDASKIINNNDILMTIEIANDNFICISVMKGIGGGPETYVYDIEKKEFRKILDMFFDHMVINQNVNKTETIIAFTQVDNNELKIGYFRPWEPKPSPVIFMTNKNPSTFQYGPLLKVYKNRIIWDYYTDSEFYPMFQNGCDLEPKNPYLHNAIHVYDTYTKTDYQLEAGNRIQVLMFDNYLAWTKWEGKENSQYINVCFAQIPPQSIDSSRYDNGSLPPYANIVENRFGNTKTYELKAVGNQDLNYNLSLNLNYDNPTSCMIFQNWNRFTKDFDYWALDLDTGKGIRLDESSLKTEEFLNRYNQSFVWPSSDCTKNNRYDCKTKKIEQIDSSVLYGHEYKKKQRYVMDFDGKTNNLSVKDNQTGKTTFIMRVDGEIDFDNEIGGEQNLSVFWIKDVRTDKCTSYVYIFALDKLISLNTAISINKVSERYYVCQDNPRNEGLKDKTPLTGKIIVLDLQTGKQFEIDPKLNNIYNFKDSLEYDRISIIGDDTPEKTYIMWKTGNIVNGEVFKGIGYTSIANIGKFHKEFRTEDQPYDVSMFGVKDNWVLCKEHSVNNTRFVARNMITGETLVLDRSDSVGNLRVIGDYIVWTVNRGLADHQFQNICFAKLK